MQVRGPGVSGAGRGEGDVTGRRRQLAHEVAPALGNGHAQALPERGVALQEEQAPALVGDGVAVHQQVGHAHQVGGDLPRAGELGVPRHQGLGRAVHAVGGGAVRPELGRADQRVDDVLLGREDVAVHLVGEQFGEGGGVVGRPLALLVGGDVGARVLLEPG